FDERDVSDKPAWLRAQAPLGDAEAEAIDGLRRSQLSSLLAVDDAVGSIVRALRETGRLRNTLVLYTADNGQSWGEHRWRGKGLPYEEDIRVPLVVRGPKVPVATTREHLVTTIDFAPTLARLAHVKPNHVVDGQSFDKLFHHNPKSPAEWRKDFLVEVYRRNPPLGNGDAIRAVRTLDGVLYAEYQSGPKELYDLTTDPFELVSQHNVASPEYLNALSARLAELATCAGDTCR
ncbi:MAG: sulfatase-like hydrolase/transferase, partial [Acidobacteriota bacterium]|nr:sulfatase-like hydrolase/transferase [Acidobacteriota bacterium]